MFRLFRRLRSGKKEKVEKEKKTEATGELKTSSVNSGLLESVKANSTLITSVARDDNDKQSPPRLESEKSITTNVEQQSKNAASNLGLTTTSIEIVHSTTPSNVLEEQSSFSETQSVLPDLDVAQQEAAMLEELIVEENPTFNPEELVEAVLFAAGRPIRLEEIVEATELDSTEIKRAITRLKKKLSKNSAFYIKEVSNELWVLQLKSKFRPIAALLREEQPLLTDEELLVLTHIAYRQPISQAVLAKILSYKIDPVRVRQIVNSLYLKEYVVMEKKARSIILRVTEKFCREFGFDTDQRRMKIQLIWRLKRQMRQVS